MSNHCMSKDMYEKYVHELESVMHENVELCLDNLKKEAKIDVDNYVENGVESLNRQIDYVKNNPVDFSRNVSERSNGYDEKWKYFNETVSKYTVKQ